MPLVFGGARLAGAGLASTAVGAAAEEDAATVAETVGIATGAEELAGVGGGTLVGGTLVGGLGAVVAAGTVGAGMVAGVGIKGVGEGAGAGTGVGPGGGLIAGPVVEDAGVEVVVGLAIGADGAGAVVGAEAPT